MKNYTINFTMDEKDNKFIERMSQKTGYTAEVLLEALLGVSLETLFDITIAENKAIHGVIKNL